MKLSSIIRNSLLTGVCIGLLSGCSWFEDWPNGNDKTAAAPPPAGQKQVVETAGGTWLQDAPANTQMASHQKAMGLNIDEASAQRIAQLEAEVENLRNELRTMMPAVAKLAAAQGDLNQALSNIQPAAGGMQGSMAAQPQSGVSQPVSLAVPPVPQTAQMPAAAAYNDSYEEEYDAQGDVVAGGDGVVMAPTAQAHDVAWYEQQERQKRQAKRAARQAVAVEPAAAPMQQQAQAAPVAQPAVVTPSAPAVMQQASAPQAAALPQSNVQNNDAGVFVRNLRFGEHADKTRLVLDTSDQVTFRYDIDNNEKLMVIEMPQTGWRGSEAMDISNSPLVSSYSVVSDNNGGHQLIMQLKEPTQVLWAQALMPGGPQGHRIVIDLAPI